MTIPRVSTMLVVLAVGVGPVGPAPASAQGPQAATSDGPAWQPLNRALVDAQREHLKRVALWGALNLVAGAALAFTGPDDAPTRRGFGLQSVAWGAINLGIAAWGFTAGEPTAAATVGEALSAEDGWSHLLLVNLGLNVGYVAVGSTLWIVSHRGVRSARALRGHGIAVVAQGVGLLVLDGLAWASSRDRLGVLHDVVVGATLSPGPVPGAVRLGWSVPWPG